MSAEDIPTIETSDGTIKLGQFLKLANLAESGSHARELIVGGDVKVDGEVDTRRGRQLVKGMLIEVLLPGGTLTARVG
ncbi:MAG: RNA-binding S4 domain-containing protein [Aeromicrobium sp.]